MSMWSDVVVLFGGSSSERFVSVASAQHLAEVLGDVELWFWGVDGAVRACPRDLLLAHEQPFERPFALSGAPAWGSLEEALDDRRSRDKVFLLALHGGEGENGLVQQAFEKRGIAFTGSGSEASALAFDKRAAKDRAQRCSVKTAPAFLLPEANPNVIRRKLQAFLIAHGRAVVKPVADGSSVGLHVLRDLREVEPVVEALSKSRATHMVEAFVDGIELTVGVVDGLDGLRALPPTEVRVFTQKGFDYAGKYLGKGVSEITPARVPNSITHAAQTVALTMHRALGCTGYSRTDVIASARGVVFLELNTLPGLTRASFVPQQLAAEGTSMISFLEGQIAIARGRAAGQRQHAA